MQHTSETCANFNDFRSQQVGELNRLIITALQSASALNLEHVSLLLIDAVYFVFDEQEIKVFSEPVKGN